MFKRSRIRIALKYIILFMGFFFSVALLESIKEPGNYSATGLGIAAAGCFISFALIENNDVRESNKD